MFVCVILSLLCGIALSGTITEIERTRFDHSSRATKLILTFQLDSFMDISGQMILDMPPPGIPVFTSATPCRWNQSYEFSGLCEIKNNNIEN